METTTGASVNRIESIDLLRGVVMIIMALDHVRDYFHVDSFLHNPTDIEHTTLGLFITRWITHLCAPTFIFLAGTSAYFIAKRKSKMETSFFLITRGIWLIVLQFTLIRFAWNFDPMFHYQSNTIISVIGICMILLSALIHFRLSILLFIGIAMVVFHNAFDGISFRNGTSADVIWSLLHVSKTFNLGDDYIFSVVYPIIPWIGVMALGYCVGCLYNVNYPTEKRKRILRSLGSVSILIFIVLRFVNIYGDPVTWTAQTSLVKTFMSFFNLTKYPPSLFYLTATLGISLHLLAWIDAKNFDKWKAISLFGKVSLFYYVLHLYVIHLLAVLAAVLSGLPWQSMVFLGSISKGSPMLIGNYGFWLGTIYFIWICIVIGLYPICDWWYTLKIRNKQKWWVSYV